VRWLLERYTGKTAERRRLILSRAAAYWGAVERALMQFSKLSARQAFLVMEEAVVDEMRKQRLDLAARVDFTPEGEQITETRLLLDEDYEQDLSIRNLGAAMGDGLVEVS